MYFEEYDPYGDIWNDEWIPDWIAWEKNMKDYFHYGSDWFKRETSERHKKVVKKFNTELNKLYEQQNRSRRDYIPLG